MNGNKRLLMTVFMIFCFTFMSPLLAKSSRKDFDKAIVDLQNSPNDLDLRKKIIDLYADLASRPEKPEEVTKLRGKAAYLMKSASSVADYEKAAQAYREASLLAPWDGTTYYNLALTEEKAEHFGKAIDDFQLYLRATPNANDHDKVLARIGKLEAQLDEKKALVRQEAIRQEEAQVRARTNVAQKKRGAAGALLWIPGVVAMAGGFVVGLGALDGVDPTTHHSSPGYYSDKKYYTTLYEGEYFNNQSDIALYQKWQSDNAGRHRTGWIVTGIGAGLTIAGLVIASQPVKPGTDSKPGKKTKKSKGRSAALDIENGELAWSLPTFDFDPVAGSFHATLVHANF